jgi:DNA mismatch endonuclease (patch repair protein)
MQRALRETLAAGKFVGVAAERTQHMRSIRPKGNRSTERRLRAYLIQAKVSGWAVHPVDVPGTPELVFRSERIAVFTDGCFWHGCQRCGKTPRTNASYWAKKIQLNIERDRKDEANLLALGFLVVRLWEHEIRENSNSCVSRIMALLNDRRRKARKKERGSRSKFC